MLFFHVSDVQEVESLPAGTVLTDSRSTAEQWAQIRLAPVHVLSLNEETDVQRRPGEKTYFTLRCKAVVVTVWWPFRDPDAVLLEATLRKMEDLPRRPEEVFEAVLDKEVPDEEYIPKAVPCPDALRRFRLVNGREPSPRELTRLPWKVVTTAVSEPPSDKVKP